MGKVSEQRALSHLVYRSHIIPFHDKWCCEFPQSYSRPLSNYSFLLLESKNDKVKPRKILAIVTPFYADVKMPSTEIPPQNAEKGPRNLSLMFQDQDISRTI